MDSGNYLILHRAVLLRGAEYDWGAEYDRDDEPLYDDRAGAE